MGMTTEPTRDSKPTTGSAGPAGAGNPLRSAVQRAGTAVVGAAADRARSGVHGVANRLDRVAAGGTGRSAAGGLKTTAGTATGTAKGAVTTTAGIATGTAKGAATTTAGTAKGVVTTVTDAVPKALLSGVGVAFALAVRKIMLLLRFLRQLALQLLEALKQLARRLSEAAASRRGREPEAVEDEDEDKAQEPSDEEAGEDRVDRREPASRPATRPRSEGGRPARPRREVPAARSDAPPPAARRAPTAPRSDRLRRRGPGAGGRGE
jgi:hypothetical protein